MQKYSKKELKALPLSEYKDYKDLIFDGLFIFSTGEIHDSHYQCITVIGIIFENEYKRTKDTLMKCYMWSDRIELQNPDNKHLVFDFPYKNLQFWWIPGGKAGFQLGRSYSGADIKIINLIHPIQQTT